MTTTRGATVPRLFGESFAHDPNGVYAALRAAGPVAWAELSPGVFGMIVTSHDAATILLSNASGTWTRDSRTWTAYREGTVPPDSPVLSILAWRDGVLHCDGARHTHFLIPIRDGLNRVTVHRLEAITDQVANRLIDAIAPTGTADLIADFARQVPMFVFAELLGCDPATSQSLVDACTLIVSGGTRAPAGAARFAELLAGIVATKQGTQGDDLASWMLAHPHQLTPSDVVDNLFSLVGAGNVPTSTWIVQALRLLLTDDPYAGDLTSGTIAVRRALQKALWDTSPVANFTFHFAVTDTTLAGIDIPAGVPVIISHHAVNTDPDLPTGLTYDSDAHLAFSAGAHRCPAPTHAAIIAQTAITILLDRIWDVRLASTGHVPNAPGLFHQCPIHLNVTFTPTTVNVV